nr:MAG TPA: hypothetical protein [Caudoviricetes sp.]
MASYIAARLRVSCRRTRVCYCRCLSRRVCHQTAKT